MQHQGQVAGAAHRKTRIERDMEMPSIAELRERLRNMNLLHLADDQKQERSSLASFITNLRDSAIFFVIISYFVGWIYFNEYLKLFGIQLITIRVPFHYFFVFSYVPLLDPFSEFSWWRVLKLTILVVLILACARLYRSRHVYLYGAAILCSLVIVGMAFQMARETGWRHAADVLMEGRGKPIRFVFKPEEMKVLDNSVLKELALTSLSRDSCLMLIWHDDKEVYAVDVCQPDKFPTYRIPVSAIAFSETSLTERQKNIYLPTR